MITISTVRQTEGKRAVLKDLTFSGSAAPAAVAHTIWKELGLGSGVIHSLTPTRIEIRCDLRYFTGNAYDEVVVTGGEDEMRPLHHFCIQYENALSGERVLSPYGTYGLEKTRGMSAVKSLLLELVGVPPTTLDDWEVGSIGLIYARGVDVTETVTTYLGLRHTFPIVDYWDDEGDRRRAVVLTPDHVRKPRYQLDMVIALAMTCPEAEVAVRDQQRPRLTPQVECLWEAAKDLYHNFHMDLDEWLRSRVEMSYWRGWDGIYRGLDPVLPRMVHRHWIQSGRGDDLAVTEVVSALRSKPVRDEEEIGMDPFVHYHIFGTPVEIHRLQKEHRRALRSLSAAASEVRRGIPRNQDLTYHVLMNTEK